MDQELDFFKIQHNDVLPEKGRVLVSEPFLQDAYFKRSVVLLTEHNDDGTIGFVLNNLINLGGSEIVKDFPNVDVKFGLGGPVSTDTLLYIHTMGDLIPESRHVLGSIFWGGDFEAVIAMLLSGDLNKSNIRFFAGCSSWYPGQLDREISENSWLVTELDQSTIMAPPNDELWKKTLLKEERKYQMWTRYPEDPLLN